MIKSIWEKIKLAFERKPTGEVLIPQKELKLPHGATVTVVVPTKPKRVYKPRKNKEVH